VNTTAIERLLEISHREATSEDVDFLFRFLNDDVGLLDKGRGVFVVNRDAGWISVIERVIAGPFSQAPGDCASDKKSVFVIGRCAISCNRIRVRIVDTKTGGIMETQLYEDEKWHTRQTEGVCRIYIPKE
jgi:hypothetical protein